MAVTYYRELSGAEFLDRVTLDLRAHLSAPERL
jgi:hypothetical protein